MVILVWSRDFVRSKAARSRSGIFSMNVDSVLIAYPEAIEMPDRMANVTACDPAYSG